MAKHYVVEESWLTHLLFNSTKSSWFWLLVRLYVGWQWFEAGLGKLGSPAWVGPDAGQALSGFVQGALGKASGAHPDVQGWYAAFLQSAVLSHPAFWSHLVAWGEAFVGVALIIGFLTGIASFFGLFMNLNYLLAGTVSTNPVLFVLGLGLVMAWKVSGYIGFDRFFVPYFGHRLKEHP